jgi:hypothetical protein
MTLRRRGVRVRVLAPDATVATAIGRNLMDPEPRARVFSLSYQQGLSVGGSVT